MLDAVEVKLLQLRWEVGKRTEREISKALKENGLCSCPKCVLFIRDFNLGWRTAVARVTAATAANG